MVNNLDLSAHAGEIASTHQRILSNDSSISWAVYGFDRGGVALNVQTEGNGPLDELSEEFDDGKVQFAFVRVQDPNTQLPKFVFISWCGQGVPVFRKGMVSSQVGEVQKVLTGSHVTIIARSEDDVQASEIMDKVERSSGAQYSYHTQPKRQPPMPAAKPAFASGQNVFKKNATYGAPTVGKGAGWGSSPSSSAAAAAPSYAAKPVPKPAAKPGPQVAAAKPPVASPSIGGTKPLFGGASGAGRPVSSFFGARSPTAPSAAISPALRQNRAVSPPPVTAQEPDRVPEPVQSAYRSQQDERRAELDAIRRGSRGTSPTGVSGSVTPTSSSRLGAVTPNEPSSHFSQADQTKNELEMLRNRRLLNTGLGGSSGSVSTSNEVSERKAELDALRRGRGGSQSSMGASQPSVPAHSWSQQQSGREEETRRRREQEEQDNRMRQQQQQQQRQREEDEERRRKQQQEQEEQRRLRQQQEEEEEEERRRKMQQEQEQQRQRQLEEEKAAATAAQPLSSSRGQKARALYDYDAEAEDELPFNEGDIIYNVEQLDPGWWAGETQDGARQGVFPANFVELIDDEPVPAKPAPALPPASARAPPPPPALPAVPAPPAPPAVAAPPPPPPVLPATAADLPPPPPPALPPMAPAPPAPALPPPPSTAAAPPPAPMLPPMLPARGRDPPVQHPFGVPPPMSYTPEAPALPPRGAPAPAPAVAAPPSAPALPPRNAAPPLPPPPPPVVPAAAAPSQQQDLGQNHALAVYDYEAAEEGELSFSEGERITHIEFPSSEWWEGVNEKGEYGLFPANYVEIQQ
ncbi:actin binding protein [Coemansia sp. RSA 486]|nr:actin binding protein [Coemansia sp. RSA 486]